MRPDDRAGPEQPCPAAPVSRPRPQCGNMTSAKEPPPINPVSRDAPTPIPVTVIPGDGVGPEVVLSARRIIDAADVAIAWEEHPAGAEVFRRGDSSGVPVETRASIERTRVVLKGPLETPVGFGEKSANVTLRKLFETYANVRPARELPGVPTRYAGEGIDFIVVRENLEDLYAGIEHMETPDVAQTLKIITRTGTEKIVRYAFDLARREGRRKVDLRDEGQHHEAGRRPLQARLRVDRARVPGDRVGAPHHRQRRPPDGQEPGPVRRRRHVESLR